MIATNTVRFFEGLAQRMYHENDGIMCVPITFMYKYNPEQFEIVGVLNHGCDSEFDLAKPILNGKELYTRVAIRRRK